MAQIELEAGVPGAYFLLNSVPVQEGSVQVIQNGDNVGLQFIGSDKNLVAPTNYNSWGNGIGGVFGSAALLLTYIKTLIFQTST